MIALDLDTILIHSPARSATFFELGGKRLKLRGRKSESCLLYTSRCV